MVARRDRYIKSTHNAISDISGQKFKRNEMMLTWDNKLVGKNEFYRKHPQLTIIPKPDRPSIRDQTRTQDFDETLLDPSFDPSS